MSKHQIGNYELITIIGSGSFATVWLGRHIVTNTHVAVKVILKQSLDSQGATIRFNREMSLLKQMNHPFIAELFEIIEMPDAYFIVMEYLEHGNMLEYVNAHSHLDENIARRFFVQLVSVLDFLHNKKFVSHRDLKAENILLDAYDNIRLIDFGLSNTFTKGEPNLMTACGSPAYAAPEMIQGKPYTKAADIWSSGIVLYAMVAGCLPFDDDNITTLLQKVVYTDVQFPAIMSRSLIDLLKRLLAKNPEQRLTISRLKEHPWFLQCPYNFVMDDEFLNTFACSIPFDVDKSIVEQMTKMGIDCKNLSHSLITGDFSDVAAIYRILRKAKVTEKINIIMTNLPFKKGFGFLSECKDSDQFPTLDSGHISPNYLPRVQIKNSLNTRRDSMANNLMTQNITQPKVIIRRMSRPIAIRRGSNPHNNIEKVINQPLISE